MEVGKSNWIVNEKVDWASVIFHVVLIISIVAIFGLAFYLFRFARQ
jgi:hypothetical protein